MEYRFYCEFQSHEPEFDYLKSLEIEELNAAANRAREEIQAAQTADIRHKRAQAALEEEIVRRRDMIEAQTDEHLKKAQTEKSYMERVVCCSQK